MSYKVENKLRFLSEASKILSSSLDYNVTLAIIGKLLVENVCDFCIIDIFDEDRKLQRIFVSVSDPKKQVLAHKVLNFPPDPKNKMAIYDAARAGRPIIIKKATNKWLASVSLIPEERNVIKKLGLNSHLFVPLKSRGEVLGVITMASMDPDFSYSAEDALFIDEIASRAGISVDKARLYSEAQKAINTRDEFLSIASHELKTPLTSILLNLQLALKKISNVKTDSPDVEKIKKMVEVSINQSRRMSLLINDLLNVSVMSTGRLKMEKEKVELNGLIEEILQKFSLEAKKNGIKINFKSDNDITGFWDKIRLDQAISSLISNSIKYGNKKPVTITAKKEGKKAVIKIQDKGIGIRKSDIGIVFNRFGRGEVSNRYPGLGVGLYICKQIIDAHKGKIDVKSDIGRGSVFTIRLPL